MYYTHYCCRDLSSSACELQGAASDSITPEKKHISIQLHSPEKQTSIQLNKETNFKYVLFEDGKKILFDTKDLSNVSFMNTDITRVRFSDTYLRLANSQNQMTKTYKGWVRLKKYSLQYNQEKIWINL